MKIAVSGKGGAGKSTVAASLALLLAEKKRRVLAVDADPDANFSSALGFTEEKKSGITPISRQIDLIEEKTGAKVKEYGQIFKLNPDVSDIADNYSVTHNGVSLLELGAVQDGGGGCACPENVVIRSLVSDLILVKDDILIMDMEAGIEHLGRSTAKGVDVLLVILEPGQRSLDCADRIIKLAGDIGVKKICFAANKISSAEDRKFIEDNFSEHEVLAFIPWAEAVRKADRNGTSVLDEMDAELKSTFEELLFKLEKSEN